MPPACPPRAAGRDGARRGRTARGGATSSTPMMLMACHVSGFAPAGRCLPPRRCSRRASLACSEAPRDEWRAVRARLMQGEQEQDGEAAASFAFASPLIEVGTLLLDTEMQRNMTARPADQAFFHKSVVLLVEHSVEGGTRGLVINRPSAIRLDGWRIRFGGPCGTGGLFGIQYDVTEDGALVQLSENRDVPSERGVVCLHALGRGGRDYCDAEQAEAAEDLSRAVMPGLWSTSLQSAQQLVERGHAEKAQLFPTVGCAHWRAEQLEAELARGSWALVSADTGTIGDTLLAHAARLTPDLEPLDGLQAWERLMRAVGRTDGQVLRQGTPSDSQLAEWRRLHLLPPTLRP